MTDIALKTHTPGADVAGRRALRWAGAFWFVVALAGQWAFFAYIAGFYGVSILSDEPETWNRLKVFGRTPYVAGDSAGNAIFAMHAMGAGIVALGGALQLIPQVRSRAPVFHRWNGRLFLITVVALSLSGFYLVWVRGTSPSFVEGLATTLNGVLILTCAAFALRAAVTRRIEAHRRWALRLYLVSNAQWFLRVGMFGYFAVGALLGVEVGFGDPFMPFWTWGCFLVPLAVAELYLRAGAHGGAALRWATAGLLVALTLVMAVGIAGFSVLSYALATGAPLRMPQ